MRMLFLRHLRAASAEKLGNGRARVARACRFAAHLALVRQAAGFSVDALSQCVIARLPACMRRPGKEFFALLESVEIFHACDES